MKKILLVILLSVMIITSFAQQGEIIYRENVALVPDTNAYITPDSCLLFWHMIPWENQYLYLDVDLDDDPDMYLFGQFASEITPFLNLRSYDQKGWNMSYSPKENTDTISHYVNFRYGYSVYTGYSWDMTAFDTIMMLQYGLRHTVTDSIGNVANYYGWLEVEGHNTRTWHEYKGGYADTLTACITRLAYCTMPDYPLRWGQTSFDWGIDKSITVHPNPTNGLVNITGDAISYVEVVNVLGQTIIKKTCDGDNVTIDLSGQPAGVYLLKFSDKNGKKHVKKVVKE